MQLCITQLHQASFCTLHNNIIDSVGPPQDQKCHIYSQILDTVVWEIFVLEIFSYNNNCLKFKRVKFSHGE